MASDRWPIALAAIGLTAACQQGIDVAVNQSMAAVEFAIDDENGDRCLRSISVYPVAPADAAPVWTSQGGSQANACVARVIYGEPPAGFARALAVPLERGRAYRVRVSGAGFRGAADFTRR